MDLLSPIVLALASGLSQVVTKLVDKAIVEPALEPATDQLKRWVTSGARKTQKEAQLLRAFKAALSQAGAPTDEEGLTRWLQQVGLDRLSSKKNGALRRQVAQAVLAFIDPAADPPEDLMVALRWPRSQKQALSTLLQALRAELAALEDWQDPIAYADQAAERGILQQVLDAVGRFDRVFVQTDAGQALRVAVVEAELSEAQAAAIEARYRQELVGKLRWHDFRGIVQLKRDMRLPLADIYQELSLLPIESTQERQRIQAQMLEMRERERLSEEERRMEQRATGALAESSRLVILGEPGAGKTISLHFIALMLAYGTGISRLDLEIPYIPLIVRLADYARALEVDRTLSLCNFLVAYVGQAYDAHPRLGDFMRLALERSACMVLLDGMDEVGSTLSQGQALRGQVVRKVQAFADHWCNNEKHPQGRCNRIVVTSRIEGYWGDPVRGFDHAQVSPLHPPDDIEAFLLRWYTAHELAYSDDPALAEERARGRVDDLLPRVLQSPGVRRLATNPLLLTILALIHENVGRLPNRRIRLYERCAQTLIESWRQAQTGEHSELLAELGEEAVIRIMAPLAYWLHDEHPGGTAPYEAWREWLIQALEEELEDGDVEQVAERFLYHARHEAGLLAERGLEQYGFFHLTFEEYLAARELARQRVEERRKRLMRHWEDTRWHEVILLTAGQLGIVEARRYDVSDLIEDLLQMEPQDPANDGRQVVLAGRALVDIGMSSVTNQTRRWVWDALRETMQDRDPDTGQPRSESVERSARIPVRTRCDAGEALDELGWLPDDLDAWVLCPGCAEQGGDLLVARYPVTNAQYDRFVEEGGYEDARWWSEEGLRWRTDQHPDYRGSEPVTEPEYWHHPRFGQERRSYPVVAVSWHEAQAYCSWLTHRLQLSGGKVQITENGQLVTRGLAPETLLVRLPTEKEWEAVAGGVTEQGRYPWDPPAGPATQEERTILARANTGEAELGSTSPVAMYPLGASEPYGLMDLAGNVWEWSADWYDEDKTSRVLRGGSWYLAQYLARCAFRHGRRRDRSFSYFGFRVVSPISLSGS